MIDLGPAQSGFRCHNTATTAHNGMKLNLKLRSTRFNFEYLMQTGKNRK